MANFNWRSIGLALFCTLLIVLNPVRVLSQQTLRVAVEPAYAPFEFRSPAGELQGFDVDLIRAVGQAAGFGRDLSKSCVRWDYSGTTGGNC